MDGEGVVKEWHEFDTLLVTKEVMLQGLVACGGKGRLRLTRQAPLASPPANHQ